MSQIKYAKGDDWLESDAQILGRLTKAAHKKGIELTLTMPWGEDMVVVVEKLNADSVTEFCSMARGAYNERIEEQKAQKARAKFDAEMAADDARAAESLPVAKAKVQISLLDGESIAARLIEIAGRTLELNVELMSLEVEGDLLVKVLKVLQDAQTDNAKEITSVESQTESCAREEADTEEDTGEEGVLEDE